MGRIFSVIGVSLVLTPLLSVFFPAEAALQACNRTSYVLYAAGAAQTGSDLTMKGWSRIAPGACADVVSGDLTADAYYLTARSSRAHSGSPHAWSGSINLCAKDKDFSFRQPFGARCPADGYELGFAQIDTHHMRSWTATFRETPDMPSMPAAERAGLKRLLNDIGVRDTGDEKKLTAALAAFRARVHLAANAPTTALFSALETDAMRSATPAGYSVCNDTSANIYIAIGLQKDKAFTSRGWWTVASGTCSHLITESVLGQKIWLRAEPVKGPPLVTGPVNFCVTTIEFDIQGRENCKKRGLIDAGFAETNVKGAAGFSAHITGSGLR